MAKPFVLLGDSRLRSRHQHTVHHNTTKYRIPAAWTGQPKRQALYVPYFHITVLIQTI